MSNSISNSIFFNTIRKSNLTFLDKFEQIGPEIISNPDVFIYNIAYNEAGYSDYSLRSPSLPDPPEPIAHLNVTFNTSLGLIIFRVAPNLTNGATGYFQLNLTDIGESNKLFCMGNQMILPSEADQFVSPQAIRLQVTESTSGDISDYGQPVPQFSVQTDSNGALTLNVNEYVVLNALTRQFDTISTTVCCLADDSKIKTNKGIMEIKNIKSSDNLLLYDSLNNPVKLIYNIKFLPTTEFIIIKKNALGENMPDEDLKIIDGHPIDVNGVETLPRTLINNETIFRSTCPREPVYTLCADRRIGVIVNNIPVYTWIIDEWLESSKNNKIAWFIV